MASTITPKQRIGSIDALRGFALFGILMFHCMEHFDLIIPSPLTSPFWLTVDGWVYATVAFLFAGKAYAIFSLLFGLSFFMQMDSQADKGVDFRLRFLWRLALLLGLGYLNGMVYMGEFFVVYAILGVVLIPLFRVPTAWLLGLSALLFLQIPDIVTFVRALSGGAESQPTSLVAYMDQLYEECAAVFINGSLGDVLSFNSFKGQAAKLLWVFNNARYPQLIGLFIAGMLIGRMGIHKSEEKIVSYSRRVLPWAAGVFALFYAVVMLLPAFGVGGFALRAGTTLFKAYANMGMMAMYVTGFMLLYYGTRLRGGMDRLSAVGRMSVTNYIMQGMIGVPLFYGFGLGLATKLSFLWCVPVGLAIYALQLIISNWWINRYYYGPVEWLWRTATWFKRIPLKRK